MVWLLYMTIENHMTCRLDRRLETLDTPVIYFHSSPSPGASPILHTMMLVLRRSPVQKEITLHNNKISNISQSETG